MAILKIVLNQEEMGEFIVHVTDDGDFLVRPEDLRKMGFSEVKGEKSAIEGEEFVSLRSMGGVKTGFDDKKLALQIIADPHLLRKKVFEFRYPRQAKVYYPKDSAAFLNYNLSYNAGDSFKYDRTVLTNQLGFRFWDLLFLSDSSYTHRKGEDSQFVRLMSNVTYDRRGDLTRALLGDFFASSGELGNINNLGGISFSKKFRIDPYFITFPEANFSGMASLPSEIEVYRDGILIRKERVSPGGFDLRDIPTYVGAGVIEVVLKDSFGKEQRIKMPYYSTDNLLKKGLHDFSYNAGFLRENFGTESNRYKDFAFLGYHRYGFTDWLTAGARGEASEKLFNFGFSSTFLVPWDLGVIGGSIAYSHSRDKKEGWGGLFSYLYQGRHLSMNFLLRGFSRNYSNISLVTIPEKTKLEAAVGAGYASEILGSISAGFGTAKKYQGIDTKSIVAGYSRNITNRSVVNASFKKDLIANSNEFNIGFNYYFKGNVTASADYQEKETGSSERVQIMKNLPLGEGFGGRASFERHQGQSGRFNNYGLQLQYNARYGQYSGEVISTNEAETYTFSAAGAFTFVKDTFGITRPIQDSFAVVKAGDLKDVRVYLNNQEMGRTGRSGKLLVPDLGSYQDNQISISDKDIPLEYAITDVLRYVSPPLKSGSYIEFGATKIQSFFGTLKVRVVGELKPVEYIEFKMVVEGKDLLSPTGKGGEFYFENVKAGKYKGEFKYLDKNYFFDIIIPKSDEIMIDLGEIICE